MALFGERSHSNPGFLEPLLLTLSCSSHDKDASLLVIPELLPFVLSFAFVHFSFLGHPQPKLT
jgi:hypothetical protein